MDRLRGRGRIHDDFASVPDLAPVWPHVRCSRQGQILPQDFGHLDLLLQPRRDCQSDLSALSPSAPEGSTKTFSSQDYRDLLARAPIQLGGPIVFVWENLNSHLAAGLKKYEVEHD
ncbi:hypothetical protein ACWDWS_37605 [Streptomyces sp. NPDC003328]|uniref:hypothetical protein n=1 Tax=Streptomyces sp. NPDC003737 TaxID=3364685 RepID=UPI0036D13170